jgi:hypothetical protein
MTVAAGLKKDRQEHKRSVLSRFAPADRRGLFRRRAGPACGPGASRPLTALLQTISPPRLIHPGGLFEDAAAAGHAACRSRRRDRAQPMRCSGRCRASPARCRIRRLEGDNRLMGPGPAPPKQRGAERGKRARASVPLHEISRRRTHGDEAAQRPQRAAGTAQASGRVRCRQGACSRHPRAMTETPQGP